MADPTEHQVASRPAGTSGGASSFRIFLNYRREDASGHAGRLYDFLRREEHEEAGFDEEQIFMDIDTIAPGVDFRRVIEDAVGSCDVFIALIGRQWLNTTDAKGRRRLDNANDFVRLEIEAALAREIPVVPALVQGAEMPSGEELPDSLVDFAHRNAIELSDARWAYDVGRLTDWLTTVAEDKARREQAERARSEESKQEAAERAERERLEREAAERAERERLEKEAAEQAERERLQREAIARAAQPAQATAEPTRRGIRLPQLKRRYLILLAGLLVGAAALGVVLAVLPSGGRAPESLLFEDNFSNPGKRGWVPDVDTEGTGGRYTDETYHIVAEREMERRGVLVSAPTDPREDVHLTVDAHRVGGTASSAYGYGLFCRADGWDTHYLFTIFAQRSVIAKSIDGQRTFLGDNPQVTAATRNDAVKTLEAVCRTIEGGRAVRLEFWVDGKMIRSATDRTSPITSSGTFGMHVVALPEHGNIGDTLEVEFDNFEAVRAE